MCTYDTVLIFMNTWFWDAPMSNHYIRVPVFTSIVHCIYNFHISMIAPSNLNFTFLCICVCVFKLIMLYSWRLRVYRTLGPTAYSKTWKVQKREKNLYLDSPKPAAIWFAPKCLQESVRFSQLISCICIHRNLESDLSTLGNLMDIIMHSLDSLKAKGLNNYCRCWCLKLSLNCF